MAASYNEIGCKSVPKKEVIFNRKEKTVATFFNQATLSYGDRVTSSNIVSGEIIEVLSATKTAVGDQYTEGGSVTYVISIINAGNSPYNALTVTDNLGAYVFGGTTIYPLTYIEDSILYYVNGVLQPTPAVTDTQPLTVSTITVPAGGNALIIYQGRVNQFAPIGVGSQITNEAQISGGGLSTPITVTETVGAASDALLSITKAISPATIAENGQLTYTFVIENRGNTPAVATDDVIVTDVFDPILNPITVTFEGETWVEGVNYTYNEATGEFVTLPGQITVPAATYTQNPETGAFIVTPGVSVLRVTGTV